MSLRFPITSRAARGSRVYHRIVILALLWLLALLPAAAQVQTRFAASLLAVQGLTQVRRSNADTFLSGYRNMQLGVGDLLRTGTRSKAQVLFADASALTLNQNTAIVIPPVSPRQIPDRIGVSSGEVWARIRHGRHIRFATPTAVAGVRGTELNLQVAADGTSTLTVVDGEVSFANEHGSVVVRSSQQSIARPGQAPTVPVTVNVPFIIEWTNDVQPAVLLLEIAYISNDPPALAQAEADAARLPAGWARDLMLGDVRHDRGDAQAALTAYDQAAAALPAGAPAAQQAQVAARRGQVLLELGHIPEAMTAFQRSIDLDATAVLPRLGLVMALLSQRQLDAALTEAQKAVDAAPNDARAPLTLALVRIRRGERREASEGLDRALALDPKLGQAHAWQAYLQRADGRLAEAEEQARRAVALSPRSAVAQQSLADVLFLQGRPREARRLARRAVQLNPLSAAAQVALGQAELALGEIDAAARAAHRAAALDPNLERSRYFLGLALAQQRDLDGAERELRRALALDPTLLEARTLLARVLTDEGRRSEAVQVAQEAVAQAPQSASAHSALGNILWRQGRLKEAAASYQKALSLEPGSVVAQIELARVYLDQNSLPAALAHALEAVDRATGSSETHAILGLVHERSGNNEQALREYRAAIALSPDNSLARIGLALQSPNTTDGFAEFAQALLRDPSVPQQQFKPGVTTELSLTGGSDDQFGQGFRHRDQYAEGKIHDFSFGNSTRDGGWRGNDDTLTRLANVNLAARPAPRLNTLYQLIYFGQQLGLPGLDFQPDGDDKFRTGLLRNSLAARYQMTSRAYLWLHADYQVVRQGHVNPDGPDDGRVRLKSDTRDGTASFELRLDQRLGRFDTLTYGFFTANDADRSVFLSWDEPSQRVERDTFHLRLHDDVQYAQLDHRTGQLSLIAGAQHARSIDRTALREELGGAARRGQLPTDRESRWLPYAVGTLQVGPRTQLRLIGHERASRLVGASLLPTEAFITGELVGAGFGGRVKTLEVDLEHRFSSLLFTKLFLLRSDVRNFRIDEPVYVSQPGVGFVIPRARVEEVGLRLERQLSPYLAGYVRWASSRATDRDQGPTHGWQLPQHPHSSLLLGLNFVDKAGTKAFLETVYNSRVFNESLWSNAEGFDPLAPRPREPAYLLLNLRIGQERSVRQEWIFRVDNLLNHSYSLWPGVPGRGRTLSLELRRRF